MGDCTSRQARNNRRRGLRRQCESVFILQPGRSAHRKFVQQIAAAKFKEQCLAILDDVAPEGIVITKHGKPVAKLLPIRSEPGALIGALRGKMKVVGDIFSTGAKWDAES